MEYHINKFSEIRFEEIDPNVDEFVLKGGDKYKISDHICHVCWDGGTVLENLDKPGFHCLRCHQDLQWKVVGFRLFGEDTFEENPFLLPVNWSDTDIEKWKKEFIEIRNDQLVVRHSMLKGNEGGDYI